jgi:hypothetical protein
LRRDEDVVNGPDDVYVEREGRVPDGLFEGPEASCT